MDSCRGRKASSWSCATPACRPTKRLQRVERLVEQSNRAARRQLSLEDEKALQDSDSGNRRRAAAGVSADIQRHGDAESRASRSLARARREVALVMIGRELRDDDRRRKLAGSVDRAAQSRRRKSISMTWKVGSGRGSCWRWSHDALRTETAAAEPRSSSSPRADDRSARVPAGAAVHGNGRAAQQMVHGLASGAAKRRLAASLRAIWTAGTGTGSGRLGSRARAWWSAARRSGTGRTWAATGRRGEFDGERIERGPFPPGPGGPMGRRQPGMRPRDGREWGPPPDGGPPREMGRAEGPPEGGPPPEDGPPGDEPN